MLKTLLFTLLLFVGQVHAVTILRQPIDLDTGQGVLHGSLMLPQQGRAVPVVLLIAGSGPTDRNGNNPGGGNNDALLRLATALAQHGIASVRFDKRGVAASYPAAPDERQLSVEGYVTDALAWCQKLRLDNRFSQVMLLGHSEGALIASLAAPQSGASGLITVAGSARPIDQLLQAQLRPRLPVDLRAQSDAILRSLREGHTVPKVTQRLQVLFRPSVQPYLISLFHQDPAAAFAQVQQPALILQGDHDIQVSVADALLLKISKPEATLQIIPGMNHAMRIVPLDLQAQLASYNNPDLPLASELTESIVHFIYASSGAQKQ
jgi:pimeloyl-ACP methyl ester carboxylesterase